MKKFTLLLLAASTLTKYGMLPIYSQDVAEGTYLIDIVSSTEDFQSAEAALTVQNGEMNADITVIGTPYEALWVGTADEAQNSSENEQIPFQLNADIGYTYTIPIPALDREIILSGLSEESGEWEEFTILADASSLPEEALLLELPDYDLIENALSASEGAKENTPNPAMEPAEQIAIDMEETLAASGIPCSIDAYYRKYPQADRVKDQHDPIISQGHPPPQEIVVNV